MAVSRAYEDHDQSLREALLKYGEWQPKTDADLALL